MSNELAPKAANELANMSHLESNLTTEELRLPRITMIQAMSPTAQDGTHRPGSLVNSLTQEEIPAPCVITPCFMFKNVIKFAPRESGGGIIYKTTAITPEVSEDLRWVGDQKPSATAFINAVCLVQGQEGMPMVASFCKTSYKTGQDLYTLVQLSGKDWWSYSYELTTKKTTNTKGTFYTFHVKRMQKTTPEVAETAAHLCAMVKNMGVETDYEGAEEAEATGEQEKREF